MPKKRRRVLPVEQPRRKREIGVTNRRMNALKHQHTHPATQVHPPIFKDAFGSAKIGHVNGVNVISVPNPTPLPLLSSAGSVRSNTACSIQMQTQISKKPKNKMLIFHILCKF